MTTRSGRHLAIAAILALAVPGARARPQPASPQAPAPQFRAAATIVEVDAIVTDRAGKFVEGLTIEDFEVLEEGAPQQVQVLYQVDGRTMTLIAGAAPRPAGLETGAAPPAPAPPQRVFVLFFDEEHVDAGEFKRLQTAAEQFLSKEFQPGDVGGVLIGGRMAGNQLTTNREALVAAVRDAKPNQAQLMRKLDLLEWPRVSEIEAIRIALVNDKDVLDQVVRRAVLEYGAGRVPDLEGTVMEKARYIVDQLRPAAARTVKTLQALINGLGRVPGRKTVVLMTDGFFVEESWGDLRRLIGLAARANVRLYSIDAMGLRRGDRSTSLFQATPLETGASIPLDAYNTVEDGPNTLAVDTGGYVIRHTNDFAGALSEVARDTSRYYVLGYTPSNAAMDGKFRSIDVRVKRQGVRVRARRGYLATPVAAAAPPGAAQPAPPDPGAAPAVPPGAPLPAPPPAAPPATPTPATPAAAAAPPAPVTPAPAAISLRPDADGRVRELAARASDSDSAKSLASRGWDRYSQGDLEGAEKLLAEAAAEPGAAPWVSYALGFAQIGVKKPQEAARSWERVRAAAPEFGAVYLDLADVYLQLDDSGRALEVLRAAQARWPDDPDVLNAVGTVQVRRGSLSDAIDIFGKAIAARPADALAHLNLARTYELRYYKMRRYSRIDGRWIDNPDDLKRAIDSYEMYLKLGGPYEDEARAAVERLRWVK